MSLWDTLLAFASGAGWTYLLTENYRASADIRAANRLSQVIALDLALSELAREKALIEKFAGAGTTKSTLRFKHGDVRFQATVEPIDEAEA